jgi:2-polyprenyl-3-methyl-5-hydroxy-6-metoxy-1,4-benzoquinol methylase
VTGVAPKQEAARLSSVDEQDLKAAHDPDQANPTTAYANFEHDHWWYVGRRRIATSLVHSILAPSMERLIVDVGCGPGGNIASLAHEYACVGIDTSPLAIEFARGRYPEMSFRCGFAPEDLGDEAAQADLFTVMDVLEHVEHDRDLLEALVAAAKPGAHFLLTVPADPALWSPHDEAVGHLRRYTKDRFETLWKELDLEPLFVSHFNSWLYLPVKIIRTLTARKGKGYGDVSAVAEGTDLRMPPAPVNALLASLFGAESGPLVRALATGRAPYRRGVSLIAVLRRS